jgi:hypothetical protein
MDESLNTPPPHRIIEGPKGVSFDSDFNDASANVFLKSSDNVIFRVKDYYLKANR